MGLDNVGMEGEFQDGEGEEPIDNFGLADSNSAIINALQGGNTR